MPSVSGSNPVATQVCAALALTSGDPKGQSMLLQLSIALQGAAWMRWASDGSLSACRGEQPTCLYPARERFATPSAMKTQNNAF
jgi:hypothetical protein